MRNCDNIIRDKSLSTIQMMRRMGFHEHDSSRGCFGENGEEIITEFRNHLETACYRLHVILFKDGCQFILRWHKLDEEKKLTKVWFDLRNVFEKA